MERVGLPFVLRALVAVGLAAGVGMLAVGVWMSFHVLVLLFTAVLFGVALTGLARRVAGLTRLPHGAALALVVVTGVGGLVGIVVPLAPRMRDQSREMIEALPQALERLEQRVEDTWVGKRVMEEIPAVVDQATGGEPPPERREPEQQGAARGETLAPLVQRLLGVMATTLGALGTIALVLYIALALAAQPRLYVDGALQVLPMDQRSRGRMAMDEVAVTLRKWLACRAVAMTTVGVVTWLGLWLLEVPMALALGVLAGFLTFVPNIGPPVAAIPAVLLGLNQGSSTAAWVAGLYILAQVIDECLVTPLLDYKVVYVPPVLTVVLQLFLGLAAGVMGVMVAAPIAAAALAARRALRPEEKTAEAALGTAG